jgi:16S rRNA (adenine1518-N6/adenine1519-N6)-dimethyltransferase
MRLNLLRKYKIHPNKRLGQNFLISKTILREIIKAANLKPSDIVLEIGPGLGILTKELAKKVKKVIAVEKDKKLTDILKKELNNDKIKNIQVINQDILKFESSSFNLKEPYKLVANLPYYITGPVIRIFLESTKPPKLMVLMVQKEVGKRICAQPPKMSKLAVFSQFYGKPEIVKFVSKKSFRPQPKVDSVILRIKPLVLTDKRLVKTNRKLFSKIVRAGFSQPRKQLINNFSKSLDLSREETENWLRKNKIQPNQRAESLALKNWPDLVNSYCSLS